MTNFEIFVLIALGIIVFAMMFRDYVVSKALDEIIKNQNDSFRRQGIIKDDLIRVRERSMHLPIIDDKLDKFEKLLTDSNENEPVEEE